MGKIDITDIEIDEAEVYKKYSSYGINNTLTAYRNTEYQKNFKIGQILVKRFLEYTDDDTWVPGKLEVNSAGAVQKYAVCAKIEGLLPVCRKFKITGELGDQLELLVNSRGDVVWEEDPDEADAILLDRDYDPMENIALMGKAKQKANRSNGHKTLKAEIRNRVPPDRPYGGTYCRYNDKRIAEYLRKQKKRTFWILEDDGKTKDTCTINGVYKGGYSYRMEIEKPDGKQYGFNIEHIYESWNNSGDYVIFSKEPMTIDEAIKKIEEEDNK